VIPCSNPFGIRRCQIGCSPPVALFTVNCAAPCLPSKAPSLASLAMAVTNEKGCNPLLLAFSRNSGQNHPIIDAVLETPLAEPVTVDRWVCRSGY